jgi:hypothetical protein
MGTWAPDTFGNDIACDWAWKIAEQMDLQPVREKLDQVLGVGEDYLEADLAAEALVACEVVARLQGRWGKRNAYSADIDKWVIENPQRPSHDLIQKATQAIDRITAEESELAEEWDYTGDGAWRASVAELRARCQNR